MTRFSRSTYVPEHNPDVPLFGHLSIVSGSPWKRHGHFVHIGEEPENDEVVLDNTLYYEAPCTSLIVKAKKIVVRDEFVDQKVIVLIADEVDIDARLAGKHVAIITDKLNVSAKICAKYLCIVTKDIFEDTEEVDAYKMLTCMYKSPMHGKIIRRHFTESLFSNDADLNAEQSAKFVNTLAGMIKSSTEQEFVDGLEDADDTEQPRQTIEVHITEDKDATSVSVDVTEKQDTVVEPAGIPTTGLKFGCDDPGNQDIEEDLDIPDLYVIGTSGKVEGTIPPTVSTESDNTTPDQDTKQTVTTRRRSK